MRQTGERPSLVAAHVVAPADARLLSVFARHRVYAQAARAIAHLRQKELY